MTTRSIRSIVVSLGKLSLRWLNPRYSFRQNAVRRLVHDSGFSKNMAEAMIDAVFCELTAPKLWKLLRFELKNPFVLDGFRKDPETAAWLRARGPGNILHVFPANVPQASILSFVLGMLLKSRNVGKLSSRDGGFLGIYLQSLKTADRALWRSNRLIGEKNKKIFLACAKKADLVVAYGNAESLEQIRKKMPATTPFFAYGHRVSVALYLKEVLTEKNIQKLADHAARDVWMADQRGCLSPVVIYAQKGGDASPQAFARCLAAQLKRLQENEKVLPRRDISTDALAYSLRCRASIEKIKGYASSIWESRPRGLWTVAYDESLKPSLAASSQTIFVKGYRKNHSVFSALSPLQKYLQCVALECGQGQRKKISEELSELGANRICRAGSMQAPPITWHHDGKPNLASWVRWTDREE